MSRRESSWEFNTRAQLEHLMGILTRTSGIYEIKLVPGARGAGARLWFTHDAELDVSALEFPDEPAIWRAKIMDIQLRSYTCRTLRECVVFGWEQMRKLQRFATHLCVWNRGAFYAELFGADALWTDMPAYFDEVYGMELVVLGGIEGEGTLPPGRAVLCGGRRFQGTVDDADYGLILQRGT